MRRIVTRTARIVVRFLTAEYSCVMIVPCGFAKAQQMINFAAAIRQHAMPIIIKRDEPIDELPHLLIGRMEDVRTVQMNLNTLFCPATAIPAYGLAFLQDQHVPAGLRQPTGNRAAPQPRTRNYRINQHQLSPPASDTRQRAAP